jgi:topoisomerase-4 subunit A
MPHKSQDRGLTWCFAASLILAGVFALGVNQLKADYIYEANQNLINLTGESGTTSLNAGDDQLSSAFNLDFTFDFYGEDFTSARMATNGCLHFGLGTGSVNYNNYCGDYTPDPLPHTTYTLYAFYTDLIRDNGSKMLAKNFSDKAVFGWYDMKEYGRNNTDNSFEVILWTNDTYEFRYGALNITNHDVLIGEQGSTAELYTYLYHDECSTGTTNLSTCVAYNWNSSSNSYNALLESGGSLYGNGSDNSACADNPLSDSSCSGYEVALFDYECDQDPQYSPSCAGYSFQESVAYYEPEIFDYGYDEPDYSTGNYYEEDLYWEEDLFGMGDYSDDCIDNPSYCYEELVYEETYGVEEVIWFEDNLGWENETYLIDDPFIEIFESSEIAVYEEIFFEPVFESEYLPEAVDTIDIFDAEELVDIYELDLILEEDFRHEEELFTETFDTIEELDEWFEEETEEEFEEERLAHEENPEEEFEEEIFEEEVVEEVFEDLEEAIAEAEEELIEAEEAEELLAEETEEKSSISMETALSVIASTIQSATNSISGTTANITSGSAGYGSSTGSGGGGTLNNSSSVSAATSSSTGGGFSTSSSPSLSDQFTSATVQTNTVLSLNADTGSVSNVTTVITPMPTLDNNPQVVMADVQVSDMQGQIDTAVSGVMTASEADQIADQIIANNIKEQQEQAESEQEETGQYADQTTLVAFLGYVPAFETYKDYEIPKQENWYQSRDIYNDISMSDNISAFYGLAGDNISLMNVMIGQQPNL